MRVLEARILGLSTDVRRDPCDRAEIAPSESTTSVGRGRELSRTDLCRATERRVCLEVRIGQIISRSFSTTMPL